MRQRFLPGIVLLIAILVDDSILLLPTSQLLGAQALGQG